MSTETAAYAFMFRSTSDGVLVAHNQLVEALNPAAAAMLAVTVEDVVGQPPEQAFRQNAALLNLFNRSGNQTLEVRLPKRRLALGMATTLPNERRLEALITTMAHDLRNPISALSGFAELVDKFGPLNAQQQKFLTRIRQTAAKLYDVVGSLVDLAWIEAGMPMNHRPIDLAQVINRTVSQLSSMAMERRVSIAVSVQDPMPIVMGDPDRIHLAIYNLLHNAILYSPPEKAVAIHAWGNDDDNEAYCSVADRGIGIADDEIELIFDRLYRSKDEQVRDTPGGGLGLTMTKTIITRHGGAIWASSNLGVGSTFTFVLPTARGQG
jgi:signal transduction histidine kinase